MSFLDDDIVKIIGQAISPNLLLDCNIPCMTLERVIYFSLGIGLSRFKYMQEAFIGYKYNSLIVNKNPYDKVFIDLLHIERTIESTGFFNKFGKNKESKHLVDAISLFHCYSEEAEIRFTIVYENLEENGGYGLPFFYTSGDSKKYYKERKVNVLLFGVWAKKIGLWLPDYYPSIEKEIQAQEKRNKDSAITKKGRRLEIMMQINKEHPDLKTKREVFEKCQEKNHKDFSITFESFSTGSTAIWSDAKEAGIVWKSIG